MGLYATLMRGKYWSRRLALPGLMLVGLVLRLWQINGAFWYDEAFSAWLSRLHVVNLLEATFYDVHPPVYYLLLWVINRLAGHTEAVLRLPSVVAGVALIWLVYKLGYSLFLPRPVIILATAITALAPFQVYYGTEARFYALLMVSITVAALGLTTGRWWPLVAGCVAALYLHNISVVFVASLLAIGLAGSLFDVGGNLGLPPTSLKWWLSAGGVITVGWLPGLIWTAFQALSITGNYWIPAVTNPPGRIMALLDDLLYLMPGNPFVLATSLATMVGLLIIAVQWRRIINYPALLFLLLAAGVPLVLLALLSIIWQSVLISRILAPIAPFYYLLLAWAVLQTPRKTILWAAVTVPTLTAILAGALLGWFGHRPVNKDYLSLYNQYRPGDAIYHANPGSYLTFAYYRPDIPQYIWPQTQSLAQMLAPETRQAMGMNEIEFDRIKCALWADSKGNTNKITRWWIVQFHGPGTTPAEMAYLTGLVSQNTLLDEIPIEQDAMVDARLYLIEPKCERKSAYVQTKKE